MIRKNKKTIFLFLLAFFIIAAIFIGEINFQAIATDSGFDTSYGGGGSGGSSGGGSYSGGSSGSHSSGGSGDFSLKSFLDTILFFFIFIIVVMIILFINSCLEKIHIAKRVAFLLSGSFLFLFITFFMVVWGILALSIKSYIGLFIDVIIWLIILFVTFRQLYKSLKPAIKEEKVAAKISKMKRNALNAKTPDENTLKILSKGYQIYLSVQEAWMNFNYDALRGLVTDELFNMYQIQLQTLELKNQQNIMKNFKFKKYYLLSKKEDKDITTIEMLLEVAFFDYIVNEEKEVIRGHKGRKVIMTYLLTFVLEKNAIEKCPHCGAQLENGETECSYCHSHIQSVGSEMKLAKKEALKQEWE